MSRESLAWTHLSYFPYFFDNIRKTTEYEPTNINKFIVTVNDRSIH